jgi:hypothetical protein
MGNLINKIKEFIWEEPLNNITIVEKQELEFTSYIEDGGRNFKGKNYLRNSADKEVIIRILSVYFEANDDIDINNEYQIVIDFDQGIKQILEGGHNGLRKLKSNIINKDNGYIFTFSNGNFLTKCKVEPNEGSIAINDKIFRSIENASSGQTQKLKKIIIKFEFEY